MSDLDWNIAVEKIKKENFKLYAWIEHSKAVYVPESNTLNIEVPEYFQKETLLNKYKDDLENTLKETYGPTVKFNITVNSEMHGKKKSEKKEDKITVKSEINLFSPEARRPEPPKLNDRLIFDNFLVGNGNKFAHAASKAVADAPGQSQAYNPLFIYGGVGLGKTHLLHAIGNAVYAKNPDAKIIITTAEKFLDEFVRKLREGKMEEFKEKYRNTDLLLIDDIQFLQRGTSAREEFFHTFNELSSLNKQIVTTSDSRPQQLILEERLQSRLSAGLVVDIQPPDFELRVAIAKSFSKEIGVRVPENVLAEIANKIENNIRDLQGILKTIKIMAEQNKTEVTMEIALEAIKTKLPEIAETKKITVDAIQRVVAEYYNLKVQDLSSKKRPENIATARQIAMYICRNLTDYSLVQIGQYFGGKDHTTVMHALDKIENLVKENEKFKATVEELVKRISK